MFVDGCFWHSCPIHATKPRANAAWWRRKLAMNARRDWDTNLQLQQQNWLVLRFWEHEKAERAAEAIGKALLRRRGLSKRRARARR